MLARQEFVETLERTVRPDEVLFVCAFAIYQNEARSGQLKFDVLELACASLAG